MYTKTMIVLSAIAGASLAAGSAAFVSPTLAPAPVATLTVNQAKAIAITGKLVDPDGKPAAKIPIQLLLRERLGAGGAGGGGGDLP